ncbi:3-isopropylmalate dehydratase small subunit [Desulfosporosinus sp. PR]|uniref:3-isopropylmalate dehydratase small subunit n=1 Tax=Candidatus Desulfosporosinus nitrosoreducens TaxID=3401928 RepID=UPI0027EF69C1|nr:3-isopropylmalate dehydratase small subunit [Desulfosporosinus sp. PR]MDQ7094862.1 3-isopropylmalate dehydratase small subunit [Desulfosporosinus sp. PR]
MIKGRVWKFGNDVDTDQIIPSQYMLLSTIEEMKQFAFEPLDKDFASKVSLGDIIVGGENFGSGSSREQAPLVLKALGISSIVAKSFARIFFRNAINIGLPVIVCKEIYDHVENEDVLEIDFSRGIIKSLKADKQYTSTKLPEHVIKILEANGLIGFLNQK